MLVVATLLQKPLTVLGAERQVALNKHITLRGVVNTWQGKPHVLTFPNLGVRALHWIQMFSASKSGVPCSRRYYMLIYANLTMRCRSVDHQNSSSDTKRSSPRWGGWRMTERFAPPACRKAPPGDDGFPSGGQSRSSWCSTKPSMRHPHASNKVTNYRFNMTPQKMHQQDYSSLDPSRAGSASSSAASPRHRFHCCPHCSNSTHCSDPGYAGSLSEYLSAMPGGTNLPPRKWYGPSKNLSGGGAYFVADGAKSPTRARRGRRGGIFCLQLLLLHVKSRCLCSTAHLVYCACVGEENEDTCQEVIGT